LFACTTGAIDGVDLSPLFVNPANATVSTAAFSQQVRFLVDESESAGSLYIPLAGGNLFSRFFQQMSAQLC
jgi:hypothetical protein